MDRRSYETVFTPAHPLAHDVADALAALVAGTEDIYESRAWEHSLSAVIAALNEAHGLQGRIDTLEAEVFNLTADVAYLEEENREKEGDLLEIKNLNKDMEKEIDALHAAKK